MSRKQAKNEQDSRYFPLNTLCLKSKCTTRSIFVNIYTEMNIERKEKVFLPGEENGETKIGVRSGLNRKKNITKHCLRKLCRDLRLDTTI